MNWRRKLGGSQRSNPGLEWWLWRRLPAIALIATLGPLSILALMHLLYDGASSDQTARFLQMARFTCWGVLMFNWTMILTVGIGCVVVMIMKGPSYVADGYWVSHSDQPRQQTESNADASARTRVYTDQN
jgi:hypothetical protein